MGVVSLLAVLLFNGLLIYAAPLAPVNSIYLPSIGRFWHISDLHFDPPYHVTDEYTKVCSPLRVSQPQTLVFLETSCVTLPAHPVSFQHMKQVAPQPEFMIWTRDSPPHVPSGELSTDVVIQVISNMTQTIREFLLDMPVYPALGNHDYCPQIVIAHVPVGYLPYARNTKVVRELYNERLVKIIHNYREIISGHFYGHTHRDSIKFLQDQQGEPVSSLFVTPAVTPIKKAEEPYSNNRAFHM